MCEHKKLGACCNTHSTSLAADLPAAILTNQNLKTIFNGQIGIYSTQ